ncbi:DUF2795 domain-containing protein [Embleya sp. NPDC008237]|uniref:DUF2795 domain-containing protein n=1 Tax=Embleya sp. NPDC008237 TaxID=3363978 RepID=UPI0036F11C1E
MRGVSYPARPGQLAEHAAHNRAGREIVDALRTLPPRAYEGPNQVCMALYGRFCQVEAVL